MLETHSMLSSLRRRSPRKWRTGRARHRGPESNPAELDDAVHIGLDEGFSVRRPAGTAPTEQ